jgi:hypothetical protein
LTGSQLHHHRFVQTPLVAEVYIFDTTILPQLGFAQSGFETAVLPLNIIRF